MPKSHENNTATAGSPLLPSSLSDAEKFRIVKALPLWRPGMLRIRTAEDGYALRGWYKATLKGELFGEQWKRYQITYIGWDMSHIDNLGPGWHTYNPNFNSLVPDGVDRPLQLCAVRIYHENINGPFIEILLCAAKDVGQLSSLDSTDSIQNLNLCRNQKQLKQIWRGIRLFKILQRPGRPKGTTRPNIDDRLLERVAAAIDEAWGPDEDGDIRRPRIARKLGLSDTGLKRQLQAQKLKYKELKAGRLAYRQKTQRS